VPTLFSDKEVIECPSDKESTQASDPAHWVSLSEAFCEGRLVFSFSGVRWMRLIKYCQKPAVAGAAVFNSQLTSFVQDFDKTCDVCQKERVGAAPRGISHAAYGSMGPYMCGCL
jgi:hypothetical protein